MSRRKLLKFTIPSLVTLVLFILLKANVAESRKRQLAEAINNWELESANLLLSSGAPIDTQTKLRYEIQKNNLAGVEALIAQGADVNFQSEQWSSPLMFAVEAQSLPIVKTLIRHGAIVDASCPYADYSTYQMTPLIAAAKSKNPQIVRYLIEQGANVNAKTGHNRNTALDAARNPEQGDINHREETIRILKQAGAKAATSFPLPFEATAKAKLRQQ